MVYPIKKWLRWIREQPWTFKWFIYLMLLRPVIDRFWQAKDPILHLSLLDVTGVAVPMIVIFLLASRQLPPYQFKTTDKIFLAVAALVISNLIFFLTVRTTLLWFGVVLKTMLPFLLYFYLRHWLVSQRALHGLLTTFVYSCVFPIMIFIIETLQKMDPAELSRGVERYSGGYADVFNYSIYFIFLFLIVAYTALSNRIKDIQFIKDLQVIVTTVMMLFMIMRIHHLASMVVFLLLFAVWILFRFYRGQLVSTFIIVNFFIVFSVGIQLPSHVRPLVKNEIAVIKGEKKVERALHGRIQRWQKMIDEFSQSEAVFQIMNPAFAKLHSYGYMIAGSHNDYLRMLFLGGFVGLFLYLVFLACILIIWRQLHFARKFLKTGALLILALFSITSVPAMYAPMMYIVLVIFTYSINRKDPVKNPVGTTVI
ncbi:hypothetical protein GF407_05835 [candidate division KSB1 bacterium]|nr:hypothetical protein [candidate division KSB1 bacterium]